MPEYRDISNANIEVDLTRRGLVYQATHKGDGTRLSLMNRSFISFTYGGKHIEDFNLIATINNDRLERSGYASFDDTVTTYDNLDGQYYWGTHYKVNELNFTLSTDGIDLPTLDKFLYWFHAGETRELILAEHPNRAILARVGEPPQISLLPFEDDVTITINNIQYKTKTTLYKGDILLKLVMDEPHWYSILNLLGRILTINGKKVFTDVWTDANGNEVNIFASQDALKILYEDGIPLASMILTNMLLGDGNYANINDDISTKIWNPSINIQIANIENLSGGGACILSNDSSTTYLGRIAGAIVDVDGNGINYLEPGQNGFFYYSGNAPAYTTIEFDLVPKFNNNYYISSPSNSFVNENTPYNTIVVESLHSLEMRLTTPNIFTSYNKVLKVFDTMIAARVDNNSYKYTLEDIRANIRDLVRHLGIRLYAISLITESNGRNLNTYKQLMLKCLLDNNNQPFSVHLKFNSLYGEAIGNFTYRKPGSTYKIENSKEDIGDMINSNYIIIRDKNYPKSDGSIAGWTEDLKTSSHRIYHNFDMAISNLTIQYKNMYL